MSKSYKEMIERAMLLEGTLIPTAAETIRTLEHKAAVTEALYTQSVVMEIGPNGKPAYTNDLTRSAEILLRQENDPEAAEDRMVLAATRAAKAALDAEATMIRRLLRFEITEMQAAIVARTEEYDADAVDRT